MNDIIITDCIINNKELKLEDIIYNLRLGTTPEGITSLYFETKDKYVYVDSGYIYNRHIQGETLTITPIIYEDREDIKETDFSSYIKHKDYYFISFIIPNLSDNTEHITALKHSYMINYIPNNIIFNYDCLNAVNIINRVE